MNNIYKGAQKATKTNGRRFIYEIDKSELLKAGDVDFSGLNLKMESITRGYVSKKLTEFTELPCIPYEGRYGKGFQVFKNLPGSTRYCITQYWVKDERRHF